MTTLLFVRHGESAANSYHIFAGHSHFPLSPVGKVQTRLTGAYIAENFKVDKIYSSDLLRAYDTACSISEALGVMPIVTDVGLREINAGKWEGAKNSELEIISKESLEMWKDDILNCSCPDGEKVSDMAERFLNTVLKIARENDGKTVVIATHATPIRAITTFARYGSFEKMADEPWAPNASVTVINAEDGKLSLEKAYINGHLGPIATSLFKI